MNYLTLRNCQHPHYGGKDHNDFQISHPAGLEQVNTPRQPESLEGACCMPTNSRGHHTKIFQVEQTHQLLHTVEDLYITADISRPTGNQPLSTQDHDQALTCYVKMVQQILYHKK